MAYSDLFWDDIKSAFERGVSTKRLSKINGVSRAAISSRAQKEGWVRPSAAEIERVVTADTMSRLTGVNGRSAAEDGRGIEDVAEERAAVIRRHQNEWKGIERHQRTMLKLALDPTYKPEGWDPAVPLTPTLRLKLAQQAASLYRAVVEATANRQEAERRAYGFDYKMQREAKRDERDDLKSVEEFMSLIDSMAERIAAPTPEVAKRGDGGSFH